MKVLITGGFGYLGSRISRFFTEKGYYVIVGSRINNLRGCTDEGFFTEMVQTSVGDQKKLDQICEGVDLIIHTVGMNAADCAADPPSALEVNSVYTARLVQSAIKAGVKRFLYVSTVHVYSKILQGELTEDTCPRNLHPYAYSHRVAEDIVCSASNNGFIEGMVIRLSNGFGIPVYEDKYCWRLLVNDLCQQSVKRKKLVLHSDGMENRNFIPISEACNIINYLMFLPSSNCIITDNRPINVGSVRSFRLMDMASLIQRQTLLLFGYTPPIIIGNSQTDETSKPLHYNISRLLSSGYIFKYSIEDEINELLVYCKKNVS